MKYAIAFLAIIALSVFFLKNKLSKNTKKTETQSTVTTGNDNSKTIEAIPHSSDSNHGIPAATPATTPDVPPPAQGVSSNDTGAPVHATPAVHATAVQAATSAHHDPVINPTPPTSHAPKVIPPPMK